MTVLFAEGKISKTFFFSSSDINAISLRICWVRNSTWTFIIPLGPPFSLAKSQLLFKNLCLSKCHPKMPSENDFGGELVPPTGFSKMRVVLIPYMLLNNFA